MPTKNYSSTPIPPITYLLRLIELLTVLKFHHDTPALVTQEAAQATRGIKRYIYSLELSGLLPTNEDLETMVHQWSANYSSITSYANEIWNGRTPPRLQDYLD